MVYLSAGENDVIGFFDFSVHAEDHVVVVKLALKSFLDSIGAFAVVFMVVDLDFAGIVLKFAGIIDIDDRKVVGFNIGVGNIGFIAINISK